MGSQNRAQTDPQDAAPDSERAPFAFAERAAKIGYWRHDMASGETTWSPGMYRLLGIDPSDSSADTDWLHSQIRPDDLGVMNRVMADAVKNRTPFYYRSRAKSPDADVKIVETHGEVELGPDGRVATIIGVCHDITEQMAAEDARHRAEEMYRVMAEQASDIIILYDKDGRILYASQALERVLGRSASEIDDQRFLELVHPDDIAEAEKINVEPLPGQTLTGTYRVRHGSGHYVWIEATSRAIHDDAGQLQNIIGVSRDVTERKRREFETAAARDRAEAANMAKSTFLANMSHELRTPLNAIIGFADIMRQQMFGPLGAPRYEEYSRLIHESGGLLLDLISDILDMAKIEAGKLELHPEELDLVALIDDSLHLLSERAGQRDVTFERDVPHDGLVIEADRRALKQILLNLLSNAVKFCLPGGNVVVRAHLHDDSVALQIVDDGIGIPASELPRLGQPFEQVTTDPTLSSGGTGLGLALVRALAEKHGGRLVIESEEGTGTTVTVHLPIAQDGARVAA